jgi:Ca2+-binding EF-hand superfamily protein
VLYPPGPLLNHETTLVLRPRCVRALKRIFILCDHDKDGALSDAELNDLQVSFASMFATFVLNCVLCPCMLFLTIQE